MRCYFILLIFSVSLFSFCTGNRKTTTISSATIEGSWLNTSNGIQNMLLFVDGYFTQTSYSIDNKRFNYTRGGTYHFSNKELVIQWEFDTRDKNRIGQLTQLQVDLNQEQITAAINGLPETWQKTGGANTNLAGVWKISARMVNDTLAPIHQTGPRKTLKILTNDRFQWVAINPAAKEFSGTGGGHYSFKNGKYTENILFFSRDSSRVGASLSFDGNVQNGDWHHSGLSSKGEKIYEVWSRINK